MSSFNASAGPSASTHAYSVLATPPAAVIHESPSTEPSEASINPFDNFFGYTFQSSTSESQHDRRLSSSSSSMGLLSDISPPAYVEPPVYEMRQTEPATLAMFLFKFGFCTSISFTLDYGIGL